MESREEKRREQKVREMEGLDRLIRVKVQLRKLQ